MVGKMFDLPDAKRIRRSDLNRSRSSSPFSSPSSSPYPSTAAETAARTALLQAKLAAIYGPVEFVGIPVSQREREKDVGTQLGLQNGVGKRAVVPVKGRGEAARKSREHRDEGGDVYMDSDSDPPSDSEDDDTTRVQDSNFARLEQQVEEREYDFLLFRPPPSDPSNLSLSHPVRRTVILSFADENLGTGRILRPRPHSYFIASKADGERKAEWEYAAVSGEQVLRGKGKRHWGLEVAWRVRVLKVGKEGNLSGGGGGSKSKKKDSNQDQNPTTPDVETATDKDIQRTSAKTKTKPNKKRRIHLRTLKRKREIAEAARQKEREGKEEAEKEKRMRRNKGKKVKRRLKAKAKKQGAGAEVGGDSGTCTTGGEVEADIKDRNE